MVTRYYEKDRLRVLKNDIEHYLDRGYDTPVIDDYVKMLLLAIKGQIAIFEEEDEE